MWRRPARSARFHPLARRQSRRLPRLYRPRRPSGRIAKILVQVGDTVRADDPVVILEAMKLENEIYADYDGVVREIRVKQNQVVNTEDVIAVIG